MLNKDTIVIQETWNYHNYEGNCLREQFRDHFTKMFNHWMSRMINHNQIFLRQEHTIQYCILLFLHCIKRVAETVTIYSISFFNSFIFLVLTLWFLQHSLNLIPLLSLSEFLTPISPALPFFLSLVFSLSLSRWVRLLSALISPQPVPNNPALNTRSPRPFCPGPDLQHPATIGFLSLPFQDLTPLAPSAIPNYLSRAPAPLHLEWVSNVRGRQQVWRQDHKGKRPFSVWCL